MRDNAPKATNTTLPVGRAPSLLAPLPPRSPVAMAAFKEGPVQSVLPLGTAAVRPGVELFKAVATSTEPSDAAPKASSTPVVAPVTAPVPVSVPAAASTLAAAVIVTCQNSSQLTGTLGHLFPELSSDWIHGPCVSADGKRFTCSKGCSTL